MTPTHSLEIPDDIMHASRLSLDELRLELALHLFATGKISFGKAAEFAGKTLWQFQLIIGAKGITAHYNEDDYEADKRAINELKELNLV